MSWGRVVRAEHVCVELEDRSAPFPAPAGVVSMLPHGNGRSYGDSCLNPGGALLRTRSIDRFIAFDTQTGRLTCEAGVLLGDILHAVIPHGWFLPVTPGTQYVTLGGAIANDVHGKNHHQAGTFGRHVRRFELLRSDGERLICSSESNAPWYAATIGGLGLTGVITWAEIELRPIVSAAMDVEIVRFRDLPSFLSLSAESDRAWEYTVAWVDCSARRRQLGRGLFLRARHASAQVAGPRRPERVFSFPLLPPWSLANSWSVRAFNALYYRQQLRARRATVQHYQSFFYPLDRILKWNRLYGPKGFYQYQCVLPGPADPGALSRLLDEIARSGLGSFLSVLKQFGSLASPGLLSFPLPGVTLALDFPNYGRQLEELFARLDGIVAAAGGRLYPAKDGRMPAWLFHRGYPAADLFSKFVDPRFSSGFWRRVTQQQ